MGAIEKLSTSLFRIAGNSGI